MIISIVHGLQRTPENIIQKTRNPFRVEVKTCRQWLSNAFTTNYNKDITVTSFPGHNNYLVHTLRLNAGKKKKLYCTSGKWSCVTHEEAFFTSQLDILRAATDPPPYRLHVIVAPVEQRDLSHRNWFSLSKDKVFTSSLNAKACSRRSLRSDSLDIYENFKPQLRQYNFPHFTHRLQI
jgi:hypothetical protein